MNKAKLKPSYFLPIYVLLVLLDVLVGGIGLDDYRYYTKPLILFSLFVYFAINGKRLGTYTYVFILLALLFSWLGDVFLMYDTIASHYFMVGLVSFLTAHVLYSIAFFKHRNTKLPGKFWVVTLLLLLYGTILFFQLKPGLGDLLPAVVIYILVILIMALTAYGRKGRVNKQSFGLVFIGALFFIASDSFLAIDKFLSEVPYTHFLVMGTYATAQFLITEGILRQKTN